MFGPIWSVFLARISPCFWPDLARDFGLIWLVFWPDLALFVICFGPCFWPDLACDFGQIWPILVAWPKIELV